MLKKTLCKVIIFVVLAIIATVIIAGCGSTSSQSAPSSSEQSTQPSTQQSTQSSQQEGAQAQQQPPSGQAPDNSKMDAVMTRAAAILGVSADSFKTAFQNAMSQAGSPSSGQQGQPPSHPTGDNLTGQGQPPSPPSSGQVPQTTSGSTAHGPDMTAIYTKMAAELNVTADAIEKAMTQAQQELQK